MTGVTAGAVLLLSDGGEQAKIKFDSNLGLHFVYNKNCEQKRLFSWQVRKLWQVQNDHDRA